MQESINTDSERGDIAPPCFKKHVSLDDFGKSGSKRYLQHVRKFSLFDQYVKRLSMHVRICGAL